MRWNPDAAWHDRIGANGLQQGSAPTLGPLNPADGNVVFQPRNIRRSSLWDVAYGKLPICIYEKHMLNEWRAFAKRVGY